MRPVQVLPNVDEPIELLAHDPHWAELFERDAREIRDALAERVLGIEHFGSTAVAGLLAKPIIDVLVAPVEWPLTQADEAILQSLGYELLGEAGVPGHIYFRRRNPHATNLAVVQWGSVLWNDNLLLRDYLRASPEARVEYAASKRAAFDGGTRTLLAYSDAKRSEVLALLESAKRWRREG